MALKNRIRSWAGSRTDAAPVSAADSLDVFGAEDGTPAPALRIVSSALETEPAPAAASRRVLSMSLVCAILLAVAAAGGYWWMRVRPLQAAAAAMGTLTIESDPPGADVVSNGELKGTTPLTIVLPAGEHAFDVVRNGRRLPLRAVSRPGTALVHHVQFDVAAPAPVLTAVLEVATEPAQLRVIVDGQPRGVSPLTLTGLAPGPHRVQVQSPRGLIERAVALEAGQSTSVIISAAAAPPPAQTAGWVVIAAPLSLQVFERGELLGSSDQTRIMLPSGPHDLELKSEAIGFSTTRAVRIASGARVQIRVDLPPVPLNINALPWAEAWIDGKRIGETPIGNYKVAPGTHDLVFRHPEFGERRQSILVKLGAPARVSVDMRKPGL